MKVAVLGAGAMGSLYGARLSRTQDVTMVDVNDALIEQINQNGIVVQEADGTETVCQLKAVKSGTDIGVQDLVIVFVKGIFTKDTVQQNLSLIGENTLVLTLQNGAGNNRDIAKFVSKDNILVGTTSHNCVVKGLGVIYHSGQGPTNIGPDVQTPDNTMKAKIAGEILKQADFETYVLDDIQVILWKKLFVNCAVNALSMVTGKHLGELSSDPDLWAICTDVIQECVKVAEADGTSIAMDLALETVKEVCENNPLGYASMYQDYVNHRKTEIDRINGAIAELADEYGIPVPCNKMLIRLVHAMEG